MPVINPHPHPQALQTSRTPPVPQTRKSQQSDEKVVCTSCGGEFKSRSSLIRHTKGVHTGTRCYWGDCRQKLSSHRELCRHLQDHQLMASQEEDEEGKLICHWPGCSHHPSKRELLRHIRKHNSDAMNKARRM
ncbi:hypothetical protein F4779DRAFT_600844 [Xylariaceae sp. FL0662B]|nr:hypothetical protein F4779DRAFT_600844 [Xylariaceae sp. FL0662B]